jgi:hypothetical protein
MNMIKVVFCLCRLPSLTLTEFQDYWLNSHGALVRELGAALRIKRYVQLHTDLGELTSRLGAFRGAPEPFDGIAEVWYENHAALETLRQDPAGRAASQALFEDEKRFIDLLRSPIWIAHEEEIIPP